LPSACLAWVERSRSRCDRREGLSHAPGPAGFGSLEWADPLDFAVSRRSRRLWGFMLTLSRGLVGIAFSLALQLAPQRAWADNAGAAQVLYDRGVELMAAKNFDEACPKLEEVTKLVPEGIGAKFTLAQCYEAQGRLASAWLQFSFVAGHMGQPERAQLSAERVAALRPKLAVLTITVSPAVKTLPGLTITRGGTGVGPAQFNEPIPVDRGTHVVSVTATGKKTWQQEIKVEADGQKVVVEIPALEDAPEEPVPTPGTPPPAPAVDAKPTWMIPVGFTVAGAGVAALGVGGVLGGLAMSKANEANDACPNGLCSAEGNTLANDAVLFADTATGLFIGGGLLAAGGALLLILAPWDDAAEEAPGQKALSNVHYYSPSEFGFGVGASF
jgi:hypothetical protein